MDNSQSGDSSLAPTFALKVALQTMKERCVALQRRLTTVEGENKELRSMVSDNQSVRGNSNSKGGVAAELFQLRLKVNEMQRNKSQLNEHISIVSAENQKLWARLSQIAKEQERSIITKDNDRTLTNENEVDADEMNSRPSGGVNQNLIRSKTFTQHSPNPNLRHKMVVSASAEETREMSLYEKSQQDRDGKETGAGGETDQCESNEVLGFAYLNADEDGTEDEMGPETRKCIDYLKEMHREALRQQQVLKNTFTKLSNKTAARPCSDCLHKLQKPEMADKSLETDESLSEPHQIMTRSRHQVENNFPEILSSSAPPLNISTEKIKADAMDKTCPMCGTIYSSAVSFDAFREHVEMHFVDDISDEPSLERNFEIVAHTVGDF